MTPSEQHAQQIRHSIQQMLQWKPRYVLTADRAEFALIEHFRRILELINALPLESLPTQILQKLQSEINTLHARSQQMDTPQSNVNSINSFDQQYSNLQSTFSTLAILALAETGPFAKVKQLAEETINNLTKAVEASNKEATRQAEHFKSVDSEVKTILKTARDTAANTGVAAHAQSFSDVGTQHDRFAKYWLVATTLSFAGTLAAFYLAFVLKSPPPDLTAPAILGAFIKRVLLVSVLYYLVVWCGRNYRTHRHLAVVNWHRHNALSTFQAFTAATTDEATKHAVLLEATRCVFGPAITGYLPNEEGAAPNPVIEVLQTALKSKTGP